MTFVVLCQLATSYDIVIHWNRFESFSARTTYDGLIRIHFSARRTVEAHFISFLQMIPNPIYSNNFPCDNRCQLNTQDGSWS